MTSERKSQQWNNAFISLNCFFLSGIRTIHGLSPLSIVIFPSNAAITLPLLFRKSLDTCLDILKVLFLLHHHLIFLMFPNYLYRKIFCYWLYKEFYLSNMFHILLHRNILKFLLLLKCHTKVHL